MRGRVAVAIVAACSIVWPAAERTRASLAVQGTGGIERAFVQGGQIAMDLSAGEYRIGPAKDASIRLRWTTRNPDDGRDVTANVSATGSKARIDTDGPSDGFQVSIEIPARSDVTISLSAGDFAMHGIEGNKDISAWAGELKIGIGRREDYRRVRASVTAGEVRARPFDVMKGGLFRSFTWEGQGRYELRVRLTAGELNLQ